jgi:hypothetical protein
MKLPPLKEWVSSSLLLPVPLSYLHNLLNRKEKPSASQDHEESAESEQESAQKFWFAASQRMIITLSGTN